MNIKQRKIENPICITYPTSDDWHPTFSNGTVEIRVYAYYDCYPEGTKPDGMIRICVRGADDTGMERDERLNMSKYEQRLIEIKYWLEHKLPNPITMDWLRSQGFNFW